MDFPEYADLTPPRGSVFLWSLAVTLHDSSGLQDFERQTELSILSFIRANLGGFGGFWKKFEFDRCSIVKEHGQGYRLKRKQEGGES